MLLLLFHLPHKTAEQFIDVRFSLNFFIFSLFQQSTDRYCIASTSSNIVLCTTRLLFSLFIICFIRHDYVWNSPYSFFFCSFIFSSLPCDLPAIYIEIHSIRCRFFSIFVSFHWFSFNTISCKYFEHNIDLMMFLELFGIFIRAEKYKQTNHDKTSEFEMPLLFKCIS